MKHVMTVRREAPARPLSELLDEWVDAGLITADQSRTIRQHEGAPQAGAPGPSLVVEALGYLGGAVMLVGSVLLVSMYWSDLSAAARLLLIGTTVVALVAAGFAVSERLGEAAARLRTVLWATAVAATATFLVVLCNDVLHWYDEHQLWIVGGGTAVVAAVLWWLRQAWLQQLVLFVPLLLTAVGVGYEVTETDGAWAGAAGWGVAVVWTTAAWLALIRPRTTGVAFGVLGAVFGTMLMSNDLGIVLGLATALATVGLALRERNLAWLGVASLVLLYVTPRAANQWFPGRLSAAMTFLVTGGLLVAAAVWVARRRAPERRGS